MIVQLNVAGGEYKHKSRPLSKQVTRNFWPQVQASQKAQSQYILQSFYGLKLFKEFTGTKDRGMIENQGVLYRVLDNTLYSVVSDGTHTALGFIGGSNRCIFAPLDEQIVIVNGSGIQYVWDGSTLTQNTSPNIGLPRGVAVLNNQAITDNGSGQSFDVSDAGTPLVINGINNAKAESSSDSLLIPYAYRETLYLFGTRTIELWYNSGQGNPPFDKVQGATINMGLEAIYSVAETADFIFFLGADLQVHTLTSGTTAVDTVVSTPALAREFKKYSVTSDAIGWAMELEGQWFYCLTFPIEDITWILPVGGEWFEWGSSSTGRIRANSYAYAFGKHLVTDYASGSLYELDDETYTDADEAIVRTRDTAPIHGGLFQQPGKTFELTELKIILEKGVGLIEGQGSDPLIAVSFSKDGGKTFGTERFIKTGKLNHTRQEVILKNCGRFMECVVRLRVSDPIYWAIYSTAAEVEVCI